MFNKKKKENKDFVDVAVSPDRSVRVSATSGRYTIDGDIIPHGCEYTIDGDFKFTDEKKNRRETKKRREEASRCIII